MRRQRGCGCEIETERGDENDGVDVPFDTEPKNP
jgi:hypothetical protein